MNKYLAGAHVLAFRPPRSDVVGYDWTKILWNPAGLAYDYYNNPASVNYSPGAAANPYWTKQRQMINPLAQGIAQRTQAAQQLQAQLRAQQQAFIQQLQQQASAAGVSLNTPSSFAPPPSMPSDVSVPPSPTPDDSTDGGAPSDGSDSSVVGAGATGDQYIVIKVKNVGDLVKKQGGALGNLAFSLVPTTISNTVYSKMRDEFSTKLKEQGVDADVSVTATPPGGSVPAGEGIKLGLIAAGTIGVGWGAWHFLLRPLFGRK